MSRMALASTITSLTFEQFSEQWFTEITEGNPSTVELGIALPANLSSSGLTLTNRRASWCIATVPGMAVLMRPSVDEGEGQNAHAEPAPRSDEDVAAQGAAR